jgi:dihydroorotase
MATSGRNSPLRGRKMTGQVIATFYAGRATVLDGKLNEPAEVS